MANYSVSSPSALTVSYVYSGTSYGYYRYYARTSNGTVVIDAYSSRTNYSTTVASDYAGVTLTCNVAYSSTGAASSYTWIEAKTVTVMSPTTTYALNATWSNISVSPNVSLETKSYSKTTAWDYTTAAGKRSDYTPSTDYYTYYTASWSSGNPASIIFKYLRNPMVWQSGSTSYDTHVVTNFTAYVSSTANSYRIRIPWGSGVTPWISNESTGAYSHNFSIDITGLELGKSYTATAYLQYYDTYNGWQNSGYTCSVSISTTFACTLSYAANGGSGAPAATKVKPYSATKTYTVLSAAISRANSSPTQTTHDLYFDADGGTLSSQSATSIRSQYYSYTFTYWNYNNTNYSAGYKYFQMPSSDVTMTAQWSSTQHVSYSNITLPTGTKTGYELEGWYTDTSYTTKIGTPGQSIPVTSSMIGKTYCPKWNATARYNIYVYYYTTDENTPYYTQSATNKISNNYSFSIIAAPSISGYKFKGWFDRNSPANQYTVGTSYSFGESDYTTKSTSSNVTTYTKNIYASLKATISSFTWNGSDSSDNNLIQTGNDVNSAISAPAWNRAIDKIQIIKPSAYLGDQTTDLPITAYYYNQLKNEIATLPGAGAVKTDKSPGSTMFADDFISINNSTGSIKGELNKAIATYNSNL